MKKIFLEKYNNEKGIGLVELMLSVSIFSSVALISSGIFINAMKAQKAVTARQNVTDNLRYGLDYMIKEIRTAQKNNAEPILTFNDGYGSQVKNGVFTEISFVNGFNPYWSATINRATVCASVAPLNTVSERVFDKTAGSTENLSAIFKSKDFFAGTFATAFFGSFILLLC